MSKPTWVSWIEYLQQHSRHYEPLTLEPHDVAGLLKHLRDADAERHRWIDRIERVGLEGSK